MIDNRESRLAVQWCYMTSPYPAIRCSFVTVCSFAILGCPSINLVLESETPRHSAQCNTLVMDERFQYLRDLSSLEDLSIGHAIQKSGCNPPWHRGIQCKTCEYESVDL